jgi:hypothetical protein
VSLLSALLLVPAVGTLVRQAALAALLRAAVRATGPSQRCSLHQLQSCDPLCCCHWHPHPWHPDLHHPPLPAAAAAAAGTGTPAAPPPLAAAALQARPSSCCCQVLLPHHSLQLALWRMKSAVAVWAAAAVAAVHADHHGCWGQQLLLRSQKAVSFPQKCPSPTSPAPHHLRTLCI